MQREREVDRERPPAAANSSGSSSRKGSSISITSDLALDTPAWSNNGA